jgi:hypothetical protein
MIKNTLFTINQYFLLYLCKFIFIYRAIFGAQGIYYIQDDRNELGFMEAQAIFWDLHRTRARTQAIWNML